MEGPLEQGQGKAEELKRSRSQETTGRRDAFFATPAVQHVLKNCRFGESGNMLTS